MGLSKKQIASRKGAATRKANIQAADRIVAEEAAAVLGVPAPKAPRSKKAAAGGSKKAAGAKKAAAGGSRKAVKAAPFEDMQNPEHSRAHAIKSGSLGAFQLYVAQNAPRGMVTISKRSVGKGEKRHTQYRVRPDKKIERMMRLGHNARRQLAAASASGTTSKVFSPNRHYFTPSKGAFHEIQYRDADGNPIPGSNRYLARPYQPGVIFTPASLGKVSAQISALSKKYANSLAVLRNKSSTEAQRVRAREVIATLKRDNKPELTLAQAVARSHRKANAKPRVLSEYNLHVSRFIKDAKKAEGKGFQPTQEWSRNTLAAAAAAWRASGRAADSTQRKPFFVVSGKGKARAPANAASYGRPAARVRVPSGRAPSAYNVFFVKKMAEAKAAAGGQTLNMPEVSRAIGAAWRTTAAYKNAQKAKAASKKPASKKAAPKKPASKKPASKKAAPKKAAPKRKAAKKASDSYDAAPASGYFGGGSTAAGKMSLAYLLDSQQQ